MATSRIVPQARFSAQARLRALQSEIMELILDRRLEAGDPLPTENELSLALGVGRNTLRESLKVLQALGVIEIRHGFGMFVAPSNLDALADGLSFRSRLSLRHRGVEALQLIEVRRALESGLIGGSIDCMSAEQLSAIDESVTLMEQLAAAGEDMIAASAQFHRRLFEPLDNELLMSLLDVFWSVYRKIQAELGMDDEGLAETVVVHRKIYAAVASRDKTLAAELLNTHLDGMRRRIAEVVAN